MKMGRFMRARISITMCRYLRFWLRSPIGRQAHLNKRTGQSEEEPNWQSS